MQHDIEHIWYTRCPVPTASGIAIQQGWLTEEFARDGIKVSSLRASGSRETRESHFDHRTTNTFRHGGNAPPIWSRSEGQDIVLIGMTWLPQYQRILALGDTNIQSAADLRGKRLALPRRVNEKIDFWRASALQGYTQVLNAEGISINEVELVDLPIESPFIGNVSISQTGGLFDAKQIASGARREAMALIRHEVDAIYNYGAFGPTLQEFLGARVISDIGHHADSRVMINNGTPSVFTVSGDLARSRPDIVARYMKQILIAAEWARENRRAALSIFAREVGIADEWMEDSFDNSMYGDLAPTLRPDLLAALTVRKNFLLKNGFIKRDFSIEEWIDETPLLMARDMLISV